MVKYKVKVKEGHDWRKHETASLSVSVGQPYHEGDKFQSTLTWINQNFSRCLIDVSDTLQRYNTMAEYGLSDEEAMILARSQGDDWINRNKRYLDDLTIPYEIVRWETWITHEDYPETRQKVGEIFNKSPVFCKSVEEEAQRFLERQKSKGMLKSKEQAFYKNSILFLLEEVAGQTLYARSEPFATIYPGRRMKPWELVATGQIPDAPKGLENETYVRIVLDKVKGWKSMTATFSHREPELKQVAILKQLQTKAL